MAVRAGTPRSGALMPCAARSNGVTPGVAPSHGGRYTRQSAPLTDQRAARRRTYGFLALRLILTSLALALPAGASFFVSGGDGGWFRQTSGSSSALCGVTFSDAAHGWAVGEGGAIRATTNGGGT